MFSTVSWQQYFYFISLVMVFYYLILWAGYFHGRLPFFGRPWTVINTKRTRKREPKNSGDSAAKVIKELEPLFPGKQTRNELLFALRSQLKEYQQRDEPGFREIINAFIMSESENKCSILISEDDLNIVWL